MLLRPIFDIHYGTINCDVEQLKKDVEWIRQRKNCYTYLGGDMIEAINVSDKRFEIDNLDGLLKDKLNRLTQEQVNSVCKILLPIKDKVMFVLEGNHEEICKKRYFYDAAFAIADRLGVPLLSYSAFVRLYFRRHVKDNDTHHVSTIVLYTTHGFGGGKKLGSKVNNVMSLVEGFEADIYIFGHVHALQAVSQPRLHLTHKGELRLQTRDKLYCLAGTYLKTFQLGSSNYAERKGFLPTHIGSLIIKIIPFNYTREAGKYIEHPPKYYVENIGNSFDEGQTEKELNNYKSKSVIKWGKGK